MKDDSWKSNAAASTVRRYEDERIAHLVRLCARGFNRSLARRLAAHEISFGQWVFLRILWKEEGLTQRELSHLANLTEPTVHTALLRLEKLGIAVRRTKEGNRRKQHVYLTQKGRDLQAVLEPLAVTSNEIALAGIDEKDQAWLQGALITILDNLERDEIAAENAGMRVPPTRGMAD